MLPKRSSQPRSSTTPVTTHSIYVWLRSPGCTFAIKAVACVSLSPSLCVRKAQGQRLGRHSDRAPPPLFCSLCLVIREDDNLDADGGVGNGVGGGGRVANLHLEVTSQLKSRRAASLFTRIIILLLRGGASC